MTEHIQAETEDQLINGTGCVCERCEPQSVLVCDGSSSSPSTSSYALSKANRYPPQFVRRNRNQRRKAESEARRAKR